jgi:molybdopterin converting factor subunit 1
MRINVKLFAIVRERAGVGELEISLDEGATVEKAAQHLMEKLPHIASSLPRVAFAVNQTYASRDTILHEGDELAIIPPVSGG